MLETTSRLHASPRTEATVHTIELAALREFGARGYDETTAEHIAATAGVSVRTFFRHFQRGKEDVMVLQFRRWVRYMQEAVAARPPQESAWTAIRAAARAIPELGEFTLSLEAVTLHRDICARRPDIHGRVMGYQFELAEPLVSMAALRMSVDPEVDLRPALMVHGMITAASVAWHAWAKHPEMDSHAAFETALRSLDRGFAET